MSPDFRDTWSFLDRRIEDIICVGRKAGKMAKEAGKLTETAAMAAGMAVRSLASICGRDRRRAAAAASQSMSSETDDEPASETRSGDSFSKPSES
eukprot:scaffold1077_cov388-Prasinococcus_capsulatus_cf.AAC.11